MPEPARILTLIFALALAGAAGCRENEPPSARLAGSPAVVRLAHPESVAVTLEWTPLRPLRNPAMRPTVFVHLIDRPNHVLRTFDHALPGSWTVGQTRRDEFDLFQSALGPPLPAGTYTLTAGLYDPALGYRWPISTAGRDVTGHREYAVVSVQVAAGRSGNAGFRFSGGWSPIEKSADSQFPQRRWLTGAGAIQIEASPEARVIRVEVRVPGDTGAGGSVASTCVLSDREISAGSRWIEARPVPGQPCEIRFEELRAASPAAAGEARVRWLALEALVWRPLRG